MTFEIKWLKKKEFTHGLVTGLFGILSYITGVDASGSGLATLTLNMLKEIFDFHFANFIIDIGIFSIFLINIHEIYKNMKKHIPSYIVGIIVGSAIILLFK